MVRNKSIFLIVTAFIFFGLVYCLHLKNNDNIINKGNSGPMGNSSTEFSYNLIKEANRLNKNNNFLISPLSIEYALSMLRDGADGNTYNEISKALKDSNLSGSLNVQNRISVANALFIKEDYKNLISNDYISKIDNKYDADIIFDKLKTPTVINNWVNEKTYKMIPKLLDKVSDNLILGIANAVAIDVNWDEEFDCNSTQPEDFTKYDGSTVKVAMMNEDSNSGELTYIKNDKAIGVIKPYIKYDRLTGKKSNADSDYIELEYIGIIPNGDIKEYVNDFSNEELNSLLKNSKTSNPKEHINLLLPRYTYNYSINDMKELLSNLGMDDMFYPEKADLSKMSSDKSKGFYVETSIHKAKIELNEKGTKAGAVTYIGVDFSGAPLDEPKTIEINFNKPFIYIIKEKDSSDILFFGITYEPEVWNDNTIRCIEGN